MKIEELYEMSNYGHLTTGLTAGTKLWIRTTPNELPHNKYRVKIEHPQYGTAEFRLFDGKLMSGNWNHNKTLKRLKKLLGLAGEDIRYHINGMKDSGDLGMALQSHRIEVENTK